ncbi:MAG: hypothetical protein E7123_07120 [Bacteroidales bacterium]|nr:hypothetical protein [Bacteroidales bacterium]
MKRFGLIGHPITHSLSPALFKAAYDGKYPYDLIEEDEFEKAYERFLNEYDAINVTAPFKELAIRKADVLSTECEAIGAANILIRQEDGTIMAANSDQMGVAQAVAEGTEKTGKTNTRALIVGCGGAAKAAAYAMCCCGYHTVILNRNYEKALDFARLLGNNPMFDVCAMPLDRFEEWFRKAGVIVYTLPTAIPALEKLGKSAIRGSRLPICRNKILLEANYKDPAFTPALIERLGSVNPRFRYISGKEWLLHQAVGAYRLFTGEEPDLEKMRKV